MKKRPTPERRQNASLRETLDDLVSHARGIARQVRQMSPQELEYAQERLEWLADEVWRVATGQERPSA